MEYLKYGIGIDMSMKKFNVCFSVIDTLQKVTVKASSSFANNPKGFTAFVDWVKKHAKLDLPKVFLGEATGVYHEQFAWFLYLQGLPISIILPNKAKKYKEALGLKSKNDKIDAQGLSRMACEQSHDLWNPLSKNIYLLRMVTRRIEAITRQKTMEKNQLHALTYGMHRDVAIEKMLKKSISLHEKNIKVLKKRVEDIIKKDPILKEKFDKITTIKGLGIQGAAVIVSELNGFALIKNQAQLVSYAGYDVVENQSGKHSGKTKISKKGNAHIRRALHFPALNVVKYKQKPFLQLYERVFERTSVKMKGYVAVQKKLLLTIYALWKNDEAFDAGKATKKNVTFRDGEPKPSFSPASQKPSMPPQKLAPDVSRAKQDGHSSKVRRMPSFSLQKYNKIL